MPYKIVLVFLLFAFSIYGQENGNGLKINHSIKFLKTDNIYTCVYTDVSSKKIYTEKSFDFPVIKTIQKIILDGFKVKKDHQSIVQVDNSTIVKFEFRTINGVRMFKIRQNNFQKKIFGASGFFSEQEIRKKLSKVTDSQVIVEI